MRLSVGVFRLQQFHEEIVAMASESQAEHEKVLRKVEQRKVQAALKEAVEPDFMRRGMDTVCRYDVMIYEIWIQ